MLFVKGGIFFLFSEFLMPMPLQHLGLDLSELTMCTVLSLLLFFWDSKALITRFAVGIFVWRKIILREKYSNYKEMAPNTPSMLSLYIYSCLYLCHHWTTMLNYQLLYYQNMNTNLWYLFQTNSMCRYFPHKYMFYIYN